MALRGLPGILVGFAEAGQDFFFASSYFWVPFSFWATGYSSPSPRHRVGVFLRKLEKSPNCLVLELAVNNASPFYGHRSSRGYLLVLLGRSVQFLELAMNNASPLYGHRSSRGYLLV